MNSFTPFANFLTAFLIPIQTASHGISAAIIGSFTIQAVLALALTSTFFYMMTRPGSDVGLGVLATIIWIGVVYGYLWQGYDQNVNQLLVQQIPQDLTQRIASVSGNTAQTVNGDAFDKLINQGIDVGVGVWAQIPKWNPAVAVPMGIAIVLYWLGVLLAISYAFMMFLAAQVVLLLLAAVGPLPVLFLFWPGTRSIGFGWLSTLLAGIFTQVLIVTVVAMESIAINAQLNDFLSKTIARSKGTALPDFAVGGMSTVSTDAASGNEMALLQILFVALVTFMVSSFMLSWIPSIATGIFRSAYVGSHSFANAGLAAGRNLAAGLAGGVGRPGVPSGGFSPPPRAAPSPAGRGIP